VPIQNAQIAAVNNPAGIWAGVNSDAYAADRFQPSGAGLGHFTVVGRTNWAADAVTQLHATGAPF
jgi:hypothetical protein